MSETTNKTIQMSFGVDDDGNKFEVVDAFARESVTALTEEIAELKGEAKTDPVTYTPDIEGFLGTSGNFITSTEGTARTDYIALDGYVRVVAQSYISSNAYSLAFFDNEKKIIKDASVAGLGATTKNSIDMVIPAGAAYCMLSHYPKGGNPGFVTLYPADSADTEDPLFAKTTNVLGDSITSTGYTRPTWWELIAERAGCYFNNYGVSGTSIAVRDGRTDSFVERAAIMQTDADAVIVMGGTNDNQTVRGAWGSTDNTTFFGALNILISTLCNNFAGKPVIICTPIQKAGDYAYNVHNPAETLMSKTDTDTLTMQERAAAIKLKCEQYGMHCLDLYNGSGINGRDTDRVYYRDGDSLHPSEAGQKRLANLMRREMEQFYGID